MAKAKQSAALKFFEVVIKGSPKLARGFLAGLVMGTDESARVFFDLDEGIHNEAFGERVAEFVKVFPAHCRVIVDGDTAARLKQLKKRIEQAVGLEIQSVRTVRSGSMEFRYEAFASRYYGEINKILKELPKDLKLQHYRHEVTQDPDAKGVESYTSVHDFEARGSGELVGPIDQVIAVRREMDRHPLIHVDEIHLKMA